MDDDDDDDDDEDETKVPPKGDAPGGALVTQRLVQSASTIGAVLLYLVVGPALILVNKEILTNVGFGYPMFVSGLGQFSSAVGSFLVIRILKLQPLEHTMTMTWDFYLKNMAVVGAAFAASLSFGNAGYMYLTVSFVQILKAFTPCVVVLFLWLLDVERPSRNVALSVLAMSLGTGIASLGELNFSLAGFLIMCCAETAEATRLVLTQRLLTNMKFGAFEGLYYMAPICCAWTWGLAAIIELPRALEEAAFDRLAENTPIVLLAFILGFLVNVASFLVIKATSSVMVKLLGTARNAGLVLFSALFLGEEVSRTQAVGYALCLAFFARYNYFKLTEHSKGDPSTKNGAISPPPSPPLTSTKKKGPGLV